MTSEPAKVVSVARIPNGNLFRVTLDKTPLVDVGAVQSLIQTMFNNDFPAIVGDFSFLNIRSTSDDRKTYVIQAEVSSAVYISAVKSGENEFRITLNRPLISVQPETDILRSWRQSINGGTFNEIQGYNYVSASSESPISYLVQVVSKPVLSLVKTPNVDGGFTATLDKPLIDGDFSIATIIRNAFRANPDIVGEYDYLSNTINPSNNLQYSVIGELIPATITGGSQLLGNGGFTNEFEIILSKPPLSTQTGDVLTKLFTDYFDNGNVLDFSRFNFVRVISSMGNIYRIEVTPKTA